MQVHCEFQSKAATFKLLEEHINENIVKVRHNCPRWLVSPTCFFFRLANGTTGKLLAFLKDLCCPFSCARFSTGISRELG
jgi:hypothetical protein